MPFAARLIVACAALAFAAAASAAEHKMLGLTLDKPTEQGWTEKPSENGLVLMREYEVEGRKGAALMAVEARPFDGDFESAFVGAASALGNMKDKEATVSRRGTTTTGHKMAWELRCCRNEDGTRMAVTAVGFNTPGTLIMAYLVTIDTRDEMEDEVEAQFDALVASFDFAGEGKRPALPPLDDGDEALEGLYLNVSTGLMPNPMGGLDYNVDLNTLFFDDEGRLADQPPAGTDSLAEFCESHADSCGTYRREGEAIVMRTIGDRFGIVEEERQSFARDGESLKLDDADYHPIKPVHDLKLDGTWTYFWASTGQTATTSGSVSSSRTLVLTPDGRFTRSGFTAVSSNIEGGDTNTAIVGSNKSGEETGAYTIDGYTMTLQLDGAETPELMSIYLPDAGDIDLLVIDGRSYLREGRD